MSGKARRLDYYPDEYISGVASVLRADEQGVYWMVCTLIMSEGGPVEENHTRIAGLCCIRPADAKRIIGALVSKGKLTRSDGKLSQKRAQSEVERASNRIQSASENGSKGGRPSGKSEENQQNGKAGGFSGKKLTNNYQPTTTNQQPSESSDDDSHADECRKKNDVDEQFELWWDAYPKGRKQAKPKCLEKYRRIVKSGAATPEELLSGAKRYAAAGYEGSQYVKMPMTWLNGGCWADEDIPPPGDKPSVPRSDQTTPRRDQWDTRRGYLEKGMWLETFGHRPGDVACDAPQWAQDLFLANKHKREPLRAPR